MPKIDNDPNPAGDLPLPPRSGGEGSGVGGSLTIAAKQRRSDKRTPRARQLRRAMTDAEKKLWWHLRRLPVHGTHFRRQSPVGPYFVDFASHELRIVIEVDGSGHAQARQIVADARRADFLNARGYIVLRFWNNDVLKDIDAVMTSIFEVIARRSAQEPPTPSPSPPLARARGGGETKRNARPCRRNCKPTK
ncbi:MAG: DUF559 domain-containing protein [Hyphomicrobium sp.]|nr:DUF559 domain-containing protein [Hyphomicrobium sp.]